MSVRAEDGVSAERAEETSPGERSLGRSLGRSQPKSLSPGLDLLSTKLAVDLQSMTAATVEERIPAALQALADAWGADSMLVALVDGAAATFSKVYAGRSTFSACNPDVLKDRPLDEFPWLKARLDHLRLLEIRDTASPSSAQREDAERLAGFNIGAALYVGFHIRGRLAGVLGVWSAAPNPEWSAEQQLALKLLGASCTSGLERIELSEVLANVQERDRLVTATANDGLWDYDVRENSMYL